MAAKALEIHPSALSDLKSAIGWYLERSEPAAIEFAAEMDRAVALVVESPARWPTGEHGTRKFILNRFPFAVVYREKQTSIQILAIAHGHRNPDYWKGRL
jgi:toxin ParE1/3/4